MPPVPSWFPLSKPGVAVKRTPSVIHRFAVEKLEGRELLSTTTTLTPAATTSATVVKAATPVPTLDFSSGFSSAAGLITMTGSAAINGSRLNLTPATPLFETGAAWANAKQDITGFTTTFSFQLGSASADGFCFVIQNNNATAIGASGGNLGYTGITQSIALKFDLYNNSGEGSNSTGLYLNGANPLNTNSIDLTGSGIDLHSGHLFNVTIAYSTGTLTQSITDTVTSATITKTYAVDIAATIGSTTAYVGFTGATGGLTAVQDITAWKYTPTAQPVLPPPTGVGATPAVGSIALAWNAVTGAASYNVYRSLTPGGEGATPYASGLTSPAYTDTAVIGGTTYYYQVAAVDSSAAIGALSAEISATGLILPPAAPTNLATTVDAYNQITLNWADNASNETGFKIEQSTDGGTTWTQIATTSANVTTYSAKGLTASTTYSFRVRAYNTAGNSAYTNIATATTGALATPINFASGFSNAAGQVAVNGSANLAGSRLNLTNASPLFQAGSAWATTKVDVTNFTTTFSFQLTNASADGFCFVIQNGGATALGSTGGNLGYGGITSSLALKFDLYNNSGEGSNSTGLYINGANPILGNTIDLTGSGIDLHSGHLFTVSLSYTTPTLTQTITDTLTGTSVTKTYSVNIPVTIGASTAYVGFTGATGGLTATQDITAWTYSIPLPLQDTQPPSTPANLALAGATSTTASLQWSPSTDNFGVTGYSIYRNNIKIGTSSSTTYTDTGLTAGTGYTYTVAAFDGAGNLSPLSAPLTVTTPQPDTQAPSAPTNLAVTGSAPTSLTLQWAASTDNVAVASYKIYRNNQQVGTTSASVTTFVDTGLTPNTPYSYTITATDTSNNTSSASTPLNVTTPAADTQPPTIPSNVTASSPSPTSIKLTWSASTDNVGVTVYTIYRNGVQITTTAGNVTTFTDTGLAANTQYVYTVTASDAAGNVSAASTPLSATTQPALPTLAGNWSLAFNENFNSIDPNLWTYRYWWDGNTGTQATFQPSQVSASNGVLNITAVKTPSTGLNGVTNPYTSGLISTGGDQVQGIPPSFSFTYGYIECRSKIAPGYGMWSSLWLLPASHIDEYELDVFEILGRSPNSDQGYIHTHGYQTYGGFSIPGPADLTADYHTYGVDWEPDHISWYLDGTEMYRYTVTGNIPNVPMYLMLNLDVGGNWAGLVDSTSPQQGTWLVDYVRVWQH